MREFIEWMAGRKKILFLFLIIGFVLAMLGRFYITKSVIGGDGVYYYSTVRAFAIEHQLDLKSELEHFYNERSGFTGNRKLSDLPKPSVTGKIPINYPVGFPVLLIPFYFIGHLITIVLSWFFPGIKPDGYGPLYQIFAALGSMAYAFAALFILYRLGRKKYDEPFVLLSVFLVCLATPLVYYMTMEPLLSHTVSVFLVTAFLALWYLNKDDMKLRHWVVLGLLGGFSSITRYQDALVVIIPPVYALVRFFKTKSLRELHLPGGLLYVLMFGAIYSLQLYINLVSYGSLFTSGYAAHGEGFIYWNQPKVLYTLFSPYCGLITRSPVVLFSFAGLYFMFKKEKTAAILLSLYLIAEIYLISSWHIPSQGDTFGNRMLLNSVFIYAVGLMEYFNKIKENKTAFTVSVSAAFLMMLFNLALVPLYCFRIIGNTYVR